ncbi:MAG: Na/Pi cotransporter family protein [Oscillospiraceae bacterium]|nr:Na/Pi cotransporter family protein [Oscillospiraceae bacterium]
MTIANIITLLGGLAFFLFGMALLGDGLKRVAGSKLETILAKLTSTTFKGVLLGALVTAAIQSSSATTVMVVGFVNSGIMKLTNAIGIIMGANIGTTATGWLLVLAGVDVSSATIFAFVAFVGIILYFFCKKQSLKNIGMILLAFSVLMSGMQSMSAAMKPLRSSPVFLEFMSAVSHPLLSLLAGAVITAIIQSASASIGILQALSATGIIGYDVAIPMIIGMCIGACAPVLFSSIGANINGRRAAFVYLYFNVAGAIILMPIFYIIHAIVDFSFMHQPVDTVGIAIINTVFNTITTIALMPIIRWFEKLTILTIRQKSGTEEESFEENLLEERFLNYPPLALEQSGRAIDLMSHAAFKSLKKSTDLLAEFNQEKYGKIMSREDIVDRYEDAVGAYLIRLNAKALSEKETQVAAKYLSCLTNLERISDHAVNLADLGKELAEKNIRFSAPAQKELQTCIDAVLEILDMTQQALQNNDLEMAKMVEPLEETIDILTKKCKSNHIQRVQTGSCTLELGFIFNDCLSNIERVADHCSNIAISVLEAADSAVHAHGYLRSIKETDNNQYHLLVAGYTAKYNID